jgi:hypothetical protein
MSTTTSTCPTWCVNEDSASGAHAHVSADVTGGAPEQPLVARLVCMKDDSAVRVLLNDRVATLGEVGRFLGSLRGLVDQAVPAEPGLGFIAQLAGRADLSVQEMAEAAGLPVDLVKAQTDGQAALSVSEFERLAIAVAQRVSESVSRTA